MTLTQALEEKIIIRGERNVVSITGGGGKTTLLKLFGVYLRHRGMRVLLTTTTKVQHPMYHEYGVDKVFLRKEDALAFVPGNPVLVFYAEENEDDHHKVHSPEIEVLEELSKRYDVVLSEADGSRKLPIKMHSFRDPVILPSTTSIVAVAGCDGIMEPINDVVFGQYGDGVVDSDFLRYFISDPQGLLKGDRPEMRSVILFNKADRINDDREKILESVEYPREVLICSEKSDALYKVL